MTSNPNRVRMYGMMATIVVILLILTQVILLRTFSAKSYEASLVRDGVVSTKVQIEAKAKLLSEYKSLKGTARKEKVKPESAFALYSVVDKALSDNSIEHTNRSSTVGAPDQSGALQIQVDFNGSYYSLLKALAALRDSGCLMRISSFNINGEDGGKVSGSMTVVSTVKS